MIFVTTAKVNGTPDWRRDLWCEDAPLFLLAGGTTTLSWPASLCERLAAGGRRVVRYGLRDSGESTTVDPEKPAFTLRDLAADAAALIGVLGGGRVHLAGIGVGGMVAQVAALDHPCAFTAFTGVNTRPVAPGPVDENLPDHDQTMMSQIFARPMPDSTDREAAADHAAARAEIRGDAPSPRVRSPHASGTEASGRHPRLHTSRRRVQPNSRPWPSSCRPNPARPMSAPYWPVSAPLAHDFISNGQPQFGDLRLREKTLVAAPVARMEQVMIVLGIILLIIGFIAKIPLLWTLGIIVLVIGAILAILGAVGREVGGRRHWY